MKTVAFIQQKLKAAESAARYRASVAATFPLSALESRNKKEARDARAAHSIARKAAQ